MNFFSEALSSHSFAVGSFNWKPGLFPCFPTSRNIPEFLKASWLHNAGGDACAITAAAINGRWLRAIEFANAFAQFRQENVARGRNTSVFPFAGRANIANLQFMGALIQFVHTHLPHFCEWKSGCVPRLHSADEITGEFRKTSANKQPHNLLEIVFAFEYQQNRFVRVEHPTRPDR